MKRNKNSWAYDYCHIYGIRAILCHGCVESVRYLGFERRLFRKFDGVFCRVMYSPYYIRKLIKRGEIYVEDIGGNFICLKVK